MAPKACLTILGSSRMARRRGGMPAVGEVSGVDESLVRLTLHMRKMHHCERDKSAKRSAKKGRIVLTDNALRICNR